MSTVDMTTIRATTQAARSLRRVVIMRFASRESGQDKRIVPPPELSGFR
jgi:hypothetical protein